MKKFLFLALGAFLISNLYAKKFTNSYVEFDMPSHWGCSLEGGQHVCQHINPEQKKEAIIVMVSKYKGPDDEIKKYYNRLQKQKMVQSLKGKKFKSKKQYTKYNTINGVVWVDSQHESSEVPNFITRYLATVQKGVGIVLTFSAHKDKFKNYTADFYRMIKSMRIRKNIPAPPKGLLDGPEIGGGIVLGKLEGKKKAKRKGDKSSLDFGAKDGGMNAKTIIFIVLAVIIVALYVIIKRKKKGKK